MKEKRKDRRWVCKFPCRCTIKGVRVNAVISDLSLGGACVSDLRRRLSVGSETSLTLRPRVENVSLRAKTVWIAPSRSLVTMGVLHSGWLLCVEVILCQMVDRTAVFRKAVVQLHGLPQPRPRVPRLWGGVAICRRRRGPEQEAEAGLRAPAPRVRLIGRPFREPVARVAGDRMWIF